jgi:pimeloyl-ACP methyl ester carboxylesterase
MIGAQVGRRVVFLPGASGAGEFWKPVAKLLPNEWDTRLFDLPGFGNIPADPRVNSFDDLVQVIVDTIDTPVDLVAQSMGGVVAMRLALAQPQSVRRLVLVATSGGVDLSRFDLEDWRAEYRAEYPNALSFVTDEVQPYLSENLASVHAPTLLIWAKGDRISPPEIGRHLASKLPSGVARLVVLDHPDHMFARDHAADVAPLIRKHLSF